MKLDVYMIDEKWKTHVQIFFVLLVVSRFSHRQEKKI